MIQALKELGEQRLKIEGLEVTDLLSILVQDPNQNGGYPYCILVIFEKNREKLIYKQVDVEETSKDRTIKYLYRFRAPQGPDYTPTAKISDSVEKTFNNKIKKWFEKNEAKSPFLKSLKESFDDSKEAILNDIKEKLSELKPKLTGNKNCFITFGFLENLNVRYLGDYSEFQNLLIESVKFDYKRTARNNHICSICGLFKNEVFGEAIPISFYTLDKPGYIASGFRRNDSWKNAPVCLECSLKVEEGKKFLDEHLHFRMGGVRYYLLPKFIFGLEEAKDIVSEFFCIATQKEILEIKGLQRISEDEKEMLNYLKSLKDVLTFNFLFYETPTKSVFRIVLLVEDILPSRLSEIFSAKEKAERCDVFKNVKIGKEIDKIEFNFFNLRKKPSAEIVPLVPSQKAFLEIVDKTFRGVALDKDLIFSWFMNTIRGVFVKEGYLKPWVLWAFISLLFFKELGVLSTPIEDLWKGGVNMACLKEKAEEFFENYKETFSSPARKALFLLGSLTQKLLNIQFLERSATPFRKNLKSLRMKESDFRALLPKIHNKLEEYGKNYYRKLEELISDYLVQSGQNWGISTDEMNFYFVLGMNLEDKVSQVLGISKDIEKGEEWYE